MLEDNEIQRVIDQDYYCFGFAYLPEDTLGPPELDSMDYAPSRLLNKKYKPLS